MNPDNTPAILTLTAAMARPDFDPVEWRRISFIVRQQTGKDYSMCTNGEVIAALEQNKASKRR